MQFNAKIDVYIFQISFLFVDVEMRGGRGLTG